MLHGTLGRAGAIMSDGYTCELSGVPLRNRDKPATLDARAPRGATWDGTAVLRGTEKLEVLARRHQVRANTLRPRRDEFVAAGRDRLTCLGDAAAAAPERRRLMKELAERELIVGEITVALGFGKLAHLAEQIAHVDDRVGRLGCVSAEHRQPLVRGFARELQGFSALAPRPQKRGHAVHRVERVGVIVAQGAAAALQHLSESGFGGIKLGSGVKHAPQPRHHRQCLRVVISRQAPGNVRRLPVQALRFLRTCCRTSSASAT